MFTPEFVFSHSSFFINRLRSPIEPKLYKSTWIKTKLAPLPDKLSDFTGVSGINPVFQLPVMYRCLVVVTNSNSGARRRCMPGWIGLKPSWNILINSRQANQRQITVHCSGVLNQKVHGIICKTVKNESKEL